MRTVIWAAALCGLSFVVVPFAVAQDVPRARALFLTQSVGFKHGSVNRPEGQLAPAEIALTQLGQQSGLFDVHCTQDAAADFSKDNLQRYQLVMFYTTGTLPIAAADLDYFFQEWLPNGGAFAGFHSATDTFGAYQPYWDMVGGTFDGHPWNASETVTIAVHEPSHPAMIPFGTEFQIRDEIYQYSHFQPEKVRVLMSLNMAKCPTKKPYHVPVSWVKQYGKGRVFYTNLGHNEATWANPAVLAHMAGGLKWALGRIPGDATPNPELCEQQTAKAKADVAEQ